MDSSRKPSRAQSFRNALSRNSSNLTFNSINKKRETEFRTLFPSLPPSEQVLETFSCALNREILLHGRMYLSERHICFHANILGWVTNLIIPFKEIMTIEKRMTAFVIPNAVQISTLQTKYFFTSFVSREQAYTKISVIWRNAIAKEPLSIEELIHSRSTMLKPRQSMLVTQEDRSSSQLASSQTDYEPTTLSSQVDSQRDKDKSPLSELCGCQDHYSECLSRTKLESWDEVHRRFFADQGNLFSNVLKEMQCKEIVSDMHWKTGDFATKCRSITCKMPLPAILINSEELVTANLTETVILDEQTKKLSRSVLEVKMELFGIPGGAAVVYIRLCFSRKGDAQGELMMAATVNPPENSWFKESIRKALLRHAEELLQTIKKEIDPTKKSKATRDIPQEEHFEMDQSYFDFNAFLRSLKTLLPLVLIFMAILSYHLYRKYSILEMRLEPKPSKVSDERIAKANLVHSQFIKLPLSPFKEAAQARRSLKRIAIRVARVRERLDKVYEQLNQEIK